VGENVPLLRSSHPDHPLKPVTGVTFLNLLYIVLIQMKSHLMSEPESCCCSYSQAVLKDEML